jgi:hypothetical protein
MLCRKRRSRRGISHGVSTSDNRVASTHPITRRAVSTDAVSLLRPMTASCVSWKSCCRVKAAGPANLWLGDATSGCERNSGAKLAFTRCIPAGV